MPTIPRPKLGRTTVMLGLAVVGGLVAMLATARLLRTDPAPAPAPVAAAPTRPEVRRIPDDPSWALTAKPVERVGFLAGRRHVFEVVSLGPTAVEVEIRTAQAFLVMRNAAAQDGVDLRLESGFRTIEQQRELFRAWRKGRGNKAARPGMSNHQSGRALDIGLGADPGALAWLQANGALFGFKRTVASEPWHWEYVDSPIARGATKRVVRKHGKAVAKRPAQRPGATGKAAKATRGRVASTRR